MPPRADRRPRILQARCARLVLCAAASSLMLAATAWAQAAPEQVWVAQCADGSTRKLSIPADAPVPEARDAALETARPAGCDPVDWKRGDAAQDRNRVTGAEVAPGADEREAAAKQLRPRRAAKRPRPRRVAKRPRPRRVAKRQRPQARAKTPRPHPPSTRPDPLTTFHTPLVLLPLYRAAGAAHGVPWEVLAAINEVETAYGDTLAVSSAGARGWMQFMPPTWKAYGVDADHDGVANPDAPADAIFTAARYLEASGASTDLRAAVFAYNHADWYVDKVLALAEGISALPDEVVASLSGLATAGPPVTAPIVPGTPAADGSIALRVPAHAAAIAVADGTVESVGRSRALGSYLILRDDAGNRFTYSRLGRRARAYAAAAGSAAGRRPPRASTAPPGGAAGHRPVRASTAPPGGAAARRPARASTAPTGGAAGRRLAPAAVRAPERRRVRLYAHPTRRAPWRAGGFQQLLAAGVPMDARLTGRGAPSVAPPARPRQVRRLRAGARIQAGTVLASAPRRAAARTSQIRFAVRPAGADAPTVDPRPLLRAWSALRRSGAYRALESTPGPAAASGLRTPKPELERRVLEDPGVQIYACGREDIDAGRIDARVLATLAGLAAAGLRPTVSSLECGHSVLTSGGRVSQHSSGNAVDIAAVNGVPVLGHQAAGSITERTVRWLLAQQADMRADQVISLLSLGGASFAQADHADHIHIGFRPRPWTEARATASTAGGERGLPSAAAWQALLGRVQALPRASLAG